MMTNSSYDLVLAGRHYAALQTHLIARDGLEAAAILFCRGAEPICHRLMVVDYILVPHNECAIRTATYISWPGEALAEALDRAENDNLSLILLHSHPGGFFDFSETDNESDRITIKSIFDGWMGPAPDAGHGSAIMVPSGEIRARLYDPMMKPRPISRVVVVGDDLSIWDRHTKPGLMPMAFGSAMTEQLGKLHACVVGVSGTGSIIAEQAARMGFGELTLIDFDLVEYKNLNRIINSASSDADANRLKVEMFRDAVRRYRPDLVINSVPLNIFTRPAVLAAARADIIFSCVDSSEGRWIADLVASSFMIPLIDMGVTIPTRRLADGRPAIVEVMGRIDYIQPLGPSLFDRGVYSSASLRAEYLARVDPETFAAEQMEGYIKGAPEEAPSVIALNMRAASAAMLEFIARAFPFRHDGNHDRARAVFALADGDEETFSEGDFPDCSQSDVGRGSQEPLLGLLGLE